MIPLYKEMKDVSTHLYSEVGDETGNSRIRKNYIAKGDVAFLEFLKFLYRIYSFIILQKMV